MMLIVPDPGHCAHSTCDAVSPLYVQVYKVLGERSEVHGQVYLAI